MTDEAQLAIECELASTTNIQQALKVARGCLRQAPEYDKALWKEAIKLLESKLKDRSPQP